MALTIKQLNMGAVPLEGAADTTIYEAPATPVPKAAVINSMIFVNHEATPSRTLNVYVKKSGASAYRLVANQSIPAAALGRFALSEDVTLGPGDKIQATVTSGTSGIDVDFVLSGFERDV